MHDERNGDRDDAHRAAPQVESRSRDQRLSTGVLATQTMRGVHPQRRSVSRLDPSAAADRRIRRRKFVRRKSAGKITARRISRRILLAVNPP